MSIFTGLQRPQFQAYYDEAVYALNLRAWGNFRYAAPDLYSLVEALVDEERVKSVLGTERTPFSYTFEPF